jgi:Zn-dependent protease with chaperone function
MILAALALGIAGAIAAPHLLRVDRLAPGAAASVWLAALALRALTVIGAVVFLLVALPQSALFEAIARWCLHELWPLLVSALGLSGHALADAAVILPALALAGSLLWLAFGAARGTLAMRHYLRERQRGRGPEGSTVVADPEVLVAVTGFGRPRVLISDTALEAFDADELAASLAHERGHLRRGHRLVLRLGALLRAFGRPLPGTSAAERGLCLQLEREADAFAVRETHDPLALASAICKAAGAVAPALGVALGGSGSVTIRLECLLREGSPPRGGFLERPARVLACALAALTLGSALAVPAWAMASKPGSSPDHDALICSH